MSEKPKCERCEEPAEAIELAKVTLIGRFTGYVTAKATVRTIQLQGIRQRLTPMGAYERPDFTQTDVTLCDECWKSFLSWVCAPGQERAKIAAENRRSIKRLQDVAERRREERVQRHMKEGSDDY